MTRPDTDAYYDGGCTARFSREAEQEAAEIETQNAVDVVRTELDFDIASLAEMADDIRGVANLRKCPVPVYVRRLARRCEELAAEMKGVRDAIGS